MWIVSLFAGVTHCHSENAWESLTGNENYLHWNCDYFRLQNDIDIVEAINNWQ